MRTATELLKKGIQIYGFNASKIQANIFPKTSLQRIENRLETLNPHRIKGPFYAAEDFHILSLLLFKKKSWKQLGIESRRGHMSLRTHYTKIIQPNIIKHSFENNQSYHESLLEIYQTLDELSLQHPLSKSILKPINQKWTKEQDILLLRLVKKIGIIPRLLIEDFPGKSSQEIYQRYNKLFPNNQFSPKDDLKLINSNLKPLEIHEKYLQNHSPNNIYIRKRTLLNKLLDHKQLEYLKLGVKTYGRDFFAILDLNRFHGKKLRDVVHEWARMEPVGLRNAVWGKQRDVELVRKTLAEGNSINNGEFAGFYRKELEARFYLLSTSTENELKQRYLEGERLYKNKC
jgi:hypothetical protein